MNPELESRIDQMAALGEPLRRSLYRYVAGQPEPVSRDQAAAALGIARHVAKFHLDRLVDDGLLVAGYRRPAGRSGPGAGRPAKVYRAVGDLEVSVPERRYDIAGRVLVRAVAASARTGAPVVETLVDVARVAGRQVAADTAGTTVGRGSTRRVMTVLSTCGFEPAKSRRGISLQNCPFHRLAEEDRELVCGMNLAFVRGVLEGLDLDDARAVLDPVPGGCCVRIGPR